MNEEEQNKEIRALNKVAEAMEEYMAPANDVRREFLEKELAITRNCLADWQGRAERAERELVVIRENSSRANYNELAEARRMAVETAQKTQQLFAERDGEIARLKKQLAESSETMQEALEEQLADEVQTQVAITAERDRLAEELRVAQNGMAESAEIKRLAKKLAEAEGALAVQRSENVLRRQEESNWETACNQLAALLHATEKQRDDARDANARLHNVWAGELADAKAERDRLAAEVDSWKTTAVRKERELAVAKEDLRLARECGREWRTRAENAEAGESSVREKVLPANVRLAKELAAAQENLRELRRSCGGLELAAKTHEAGADVLSKDLVASRERIKFLEQQADTNRREADSWRDEAHRLGNALLEEKEAFKDRLFDEKTDAEQVLTKTVECERLAFQAELRKAEAAASLLREVEAARGATVAGLEDELRQAKGSIENWKVATESARDEADQFRRQLRHTDTALGEANAMLAKQAEEILAARRWEETVKDGLRGELDGNKDVVDGLEEKLAIFAGRNTALRKENARLGEELRQAWVELKHGPSLDGEKQ